MYPYTVTVKKNYYNFQNIVPQQNGYPPNSDNLANRRLIKYNEIEQRSKPLLPLHHQPSKGESLREYVPEQGIGDPIKWYKNSYFFLLPKGLTYFRPIITQPCVIYTHSLILLPVK